jgi:nitrogen fixation protein NifZ
MMQAGIPQYAWGQRVHAAVDLHNDGSYPDQPLDALLVSSGETGEVVQVGQHTDPGLVIYMVEFAVHRVVGCFEQELIPCHSDGGVQ